MDKINENKAIKARAQKFRARSAPRLRCVTRLFRSRNSEGGSWKAAAKILLRQTGLAVGREAASRDQVTRAIRMKSANNPMSANNNNLIFFL
jgi:hypothetical protein